MKKKQIGKNAGLIWHTLEQVREITLIELCNITSLTLEETSLALGWLAREDKIFIHKENSVIIIRLQKNPIEFSFG